VRAGGAGRAEHRIGIRLDAHSGDVLGDGSVEQLDRLRDEADMLAELVRIPLVERGAVEPHATFGRPPDAHKGAYQRGLAGAAWTDDPQRLALIESEAHVGDNRFRAYLFKSITHLGVDTRGRLRPRQTATSNRER
jgi:hypothetical protein